MKEPRLTKEDLRIWHSWRKICILHSQTDEFYQTIENSCQYALEMYNRYPKAYLTWSAGKDSTAMVHLVRVDCQIPATIMSIKDDCDYPGEIDYIKHLAQKWAVQVDIIKPKKSVQEYAAELEIQVGEDVHSRGKFSNKVFYNLINQYRKQLGFPGVYLGLRTEESKARLNNRNYRGHIYTKKNGEAVCQPICDWSGKDVFAYLFSRNIDPFIVYKCCRLHKLPSEIRKSWWLGGTSSRFSYNIWLKTYWPTLFRKLCKIVDRAEIVA